MIWDTIANIPAPQLLAFILGGLALNFAPGQDVFFASACGIQNGPRAGALAGLALTLLIITRMAASRFGVVLRAAAANETRVVAVGVAPWPYRLVAFTVSGFFAGMAGALLAASQQFISPVDMAWDRSGDFVVMAVLGGIATVWGPVIGAAAFIVLELVLSSWTQHWHLAFGFIILMVVIFLRGGLADLTHVLKPRAATGGGHG